MNTKERKYVSLNITNTITRRKIKRHTKTTYKITPLHLDHKAINKNTNEKKLDPCEKTLILIEDKKNDLEW